MKKYLAGILVMALLLLTACDTNEENNNHNSDGGLQYIETYNTVGGANTKDGYYLLESVYGETIDSTWKNIMYIDYSTKKQVYLCSSPSCEHNNETCTSWLSGKEGDTAIHVVGDKLILFMSGYQPFEEEGGTATPPHIDTMDFNGSNRKTVATFDSDTYLDSYNIIHDGQAVYVVTSTMEETGKMEQHKDPEGNVIDEYPEIITHYKLVKVDLEAGERQELFEIKERDRITGVTKDALLVQRNMESDVTVDETRIEELQNRMMQLEEELSYENIEQSEEWRSLSKELDEIYTEQHDSMKNEIAHLPLEGGEEKMIKQWTNAEFDNFRVINAVLYCILPDEGTVNAINLETGEEKTILEGLPQGDHYWYVYGVFDGHLILNGSYSGGEESEYKVIQYGIDLSNNEQKELTLKVDVTDLSQGGAVPSNPQAASVVLASIIQLPLTTEEDDNITQAEPLSSAASKNEPIQIIAETEEHFLVINHYTIGTRTSQMRGETYEEYYEDPTYSLIKKEDYWNNNPVYETVEFVK